MSESELRLVSDNTKMEPQSSILTLEKLEEAVETLYVEFMRLMLNRLVADGRLDQLEAELFELRKQAIKYERLIKKRTHTKGGLKQKK